MVVDSLVIKYGRTHNLGDFNSVRVDFEIGAMVEEGDDLVAAVKALREMARNNVIHELSRVEPKLAAKVEGIMLGLPAELQSEIENNAD